MNNENNENNKKKTKINFIIDIFIVIFGSYITLLIGITIISFGDYNIIQIISIFLGICIQIIGLNSILVKLYNK